MSRNDWLNKTIPSVDLPVGEAHGWTLEKFDIDKDGAAGFNIRTQINMDGWGRGRTVVPGTYYRLLRNSTLVMSDTPAEKWDHFGFVRNAYGRVLIGGLGMGLVLNGVARRDEVENVLVIEKEDGPIALVWDFYKERYGDKIELIQADILTWKSPIGYDLWDYAWFDIWDDICTDNWEQYKLLHRRFARKAKVKDSWSRDLVRDLGRSGW